MSRYYIIRDGQKVYSSTVKGIARLAQQLSDDLQQSVWVHIDHGAKATVVGKKRTEKVAKVTHRMRRNPTPKKSYIVEGALPTKGSKFIKQLVTDDRAKALAHANSLKNMGYKARVR